MGVDEYRWVIGASALVLTEWAGHSISYTHLQCLYGTQRSFSHIPSYPSLPRCGLSSISVAKKFCNLRSKLSQCQEVVLLFSCQVSCDLFGMLKPQALSKLKQYFYCTQCKARILAHCGIFGLIHVLGKVSAEIWPMSIYKIS